MVAHLAGGAPKESDLGMAGGIDSTDGSIAGPGYHLTTSGQNRSHRNLSPPGSPPGHAQGILHMTGIFGDPTFGAGLGSGASVARVNGHAAFIFLLLPAGGQPNPLESLVSTSPGRGATV